MTQNQKVIRYLRANIGLTQMGAIYKLNITDLAARIRDLRKMGYKIDTVWKTSVNEDGRTTRYAMYQLDIENSEDALKL